MGYCKLSESTEIKKIIWDVLVNGSSTGIFIDLQNLEVAEKQYELIRQRARTEFGILIPDWTKLALTKQNEGA